MKYLESMYITNETIHAVREVLAAIAMMSDEDSDH